LRFKSVVPAILLGIPIPESGNPFLVAPVAEAIVDVEFQRCPSPRISCEGVGGIEGLIQSFWLKLSKGLGLSLCSTLKLLEVDVPSKPPRGGLYASLTATLLYALHRFHGDTVGVLDIVETSSLVDLADVDRSWGIAVEALRYSAVAGKPVAYRGPLEVYEFEGRRGVRVEVLDYAGNLRSLVSRDSLGSSVYGALVHLMGEAVLEASMRIRDGSEVGEAVETLKPIHDAVALAVYGLKPRGERCLWSPGLPWSFDEVCIVE